MGCPTFTGGPDGSPEELLELEVLLEEVLDELLDELLLDEVLLELLELDELLEVLPPLLLPPQAAKSAVNSTAALARMSMRWVGVYRVSDVDCVPIWWFIYESPLCARGVGSTPATISSIFFL